jgi:hypothetical protein
VDKMNNSGSDEGEIKGIGSCARSVCWEWRLCTRYGPSNSDSEYYDSDTLLFAATTND